MISLINPTNFRLSIVCATLGERPIKIEAIRQEQGLENYEIKFLELIEEITNGSQIDISKSGVSVKYYPGIITNNEEKEIVFDCGNERGITYFLEPILILALFGKSVLRLTLKGITNSDIDQSVDNFINCAIPLIKKFDIQEEISLKIIKRGFPPNGGGEVKLVCSFIKFLRAIDFTQQGLFKRIRGVAYAGKVAIQSVNRIVSGAREVLNDYIPDVWVYSDFCKGNKAGFSPGYGISLVAESTNGFTFISVDEIMEQNNTNSKNNKEENLPENIGKKCAIRLLDEIMYSGCVDSSNQSLVLTLMALSEKSISKVLIGRLTSYSIETLRTLRAFFGVTFKIEPYEDQNQIQLQQEQNNEEQELIQNDENQIDLEDLQQNQIQKQEQEEEVKQTKPMIFSCLGINLVNISRKVN